MTRNRQARREAVRLYKLRNASQSRHGPTRPRSALALRKTMQLCRQVEQTLSLVLSGECKDEVLQSLLVESVRPAPNASQLLVTVRQTASDAPVSTLEILTRLTEVAGQLRFEVASAITRKRAPKLVFEVL